jgi:hypothetical protein
VIGLADIDVNELETGVNGAFATLDGRTVIKVDVHFDAEFGAIVIDQITHIFDAHGLDFVVTDLDQNRRVEVFGRRRYSAQSFLVVNVERPDREVLCPRSLHEMPRPERSFPNFANCHVPSLG